MNCRWIYLFSLPYCLILLRCAYRTHIYGDFEDLSEGEDEMFVFTRAWESSRALILLNFSEEEHTFSLPARMLETTMTLLLGNYDDQGVTSTATRIRLRPCDGCLYMTGIYKVVTI